MKKWLVAAGLTTTIFVTAACGNEEVNGQGPSDVAIQWVNAEIQNNQHKMLELLDEKSIALDKEIKGDNESEAENYKLTEWKASDNRYFYEMIYENPEDKKMVTERMEIIKTDDGWKRTSYSDLRNFDTHIADIEPKILKELHNQ
ncbi:hypothetical protein MKX78_24295 [Cytobacillus sp. FSL R5-0569]|uniref:hypothetical protein n=1 Tax=unclassified Cytobacillus TaxID=2675268 RepID=UPI0030FCB30E